MGTGVTSVLCMNGRNKPLGHIDPVGSKGLRTQTFVSDIKVLSVFFITTSRQWLTVYVKT